MKVRKMKMVNFRGYRSETEVDFNNLTVFVGKNDVGKSTILEALDLFFNDGKGNIKYDKDDLTIDSEEKFFSIEVIFSEIPEEVIVDSTYKTSLKEEYLLDANSKLDIIKKINGSKCCGTYIRAMHPTNEKCSDLLIKKITDLRKILKENSIQCDNKATNAIIRKSIWKHFENELELKLVDIDVTGSEDTKKIWNKLSTFLPIYTIFQSDRANTDGDKEVQDPLKVAVTQFIKDSEIQKELDDVAMKVGEKLREVSERTLEKLKEMAPDIANSLEPVIPATSSLKWADVFKNVSITGDDAIPINKRGSGVKRLVLLNFFRAEAERRLKATDGTGVIYAIEEPETSQHFENQRILVNALVELSKVDNTQVIITTHSGVIVKNLKYDDLRLVTTKINNEKEVIKIKDSILLYPSLNEVNYTAFGEVTEEYHDELYGFIEYNNWRSEYEKSKPKIPYIRLKQNGDIVEEEKTLTHYIRDVMHHPENKKNRKYTYDELGKSIEEMRNYIKEKLKNQTHMDCIKV